MARVAEVGLARLHGADLSFAQLHGAALWNAQLQAAYLRGAQLYGAEFPHTQLQGTDLGAAELQGADLRNANLQGANLRVAQFHGADLTGAHLEGADLRSAEFYGAIFAQSSHTLLDVPSARWTPLEKKAVAGMRAMLANTTTRAQWDREVLARTAKPGLPPPSLESCLIDPQVTPELNCEEKWLPAEIEAFRNKLFPVLEKLACESCWIAGGLIRQIDPSETTSGRFGLARRFTALMDKQECEGLSSLPEADKDRIRDLAKREQELRGLLEAGKPAGEVPASLTTPPAIAPEPP